MVEHPVSKNLRFVGILFLSVLAVLWFPECLMLFATGFGWWKGCGCCSSCTIFQDDYSTDRTGSDYTTVSGSWSVSAGAISTSSSSAMIIENTASGTGGGGLYATVTFTPASTSDVGRLIVAYTDSNNYCFAEVQAGASDGSLKLYQVVAGSATQLGETVVLTGYTSGAKTICICIGPNFVSASAGSKGTSAAATITTTSKKAGIATGTLTGTVTFDNFSFKNRYTSGSSCKMCCDFDPATGDGSGGGEFGLSPCVLVCDTGTAHSAVQAVLAGYSNDGNCASCASLNYTAIMARPQVDACYWKGPGPGVCNTDYIDLEPSNPNPLILHAISGIGHTWSGTITGDCGWSGTTVTNSSLVWQNGSASFECAHSSASPGKFATLTAL